MPTNRLYSYKYPFDIRATLEPWRAKLGESFDNVVATLSDRDRALEDWVNLGMSQGRLGYETSTAFQTPITSEVDLTDLTVTVTVPANRVLKVTGQAVFHLSGDAASFGWISEDGTHVSAFADFQNFYGGAGAEALQQGAAILTPSAGTHTYKLSAERTSGAATLTVGGVATAPAFILVEDIGPVNT